MAEIVIQMPEKVNIIIRKLQAAGYDAYAVGGCIRDSLLGRVPNDWDITTSAKPPEVKALFSRTIDTGIKHGTVTVLLNGEGFEVTTYRIDGEYEDSRHPREVSFTENLSEDLKRRDFTINALAYNDTAGLIDIFDGQKDLNDGVIRCVGNAKERFTEDALRILRAIRFSAQLGYRIEENTLSAIKELSASLKKISAERIQAELVKLMVSPHPDYLRTAYECGVTKVILPEFDLAMETPQNHPHHCYCVGEHILHSLLEVPADKVLRLSMLLHDIAKPACLKVDEKGLTHFHGHEEKGALMSRDILKRLRFDNDTIDKVCRLVRFHDYGNGINPDKRIVRRAVNKIGEDLFSDFLIVKKADILAQSMYLREEKIADLKAWELCYGKITEDRECVSLRTLAVNGKDLIAEGIKPGKELGDILQRLLEVVLDDPSKNEKEYLLSLVKQ